MSSSAVCKPPLLEASQPATNNLRSRRSPQDGELRFFNPYADIRHTENRLPHWQQQGATYFVTFRLADSVPSHVLGQWQNEREAWLRLHPEPWTLEIELEYHRRFSRALEQWLDQGHGACLLRRHDCAEIVAETLRHFEGERIVMIFIRRDAESRSRVVCSKS